MIAKQPTSLPLQDDCNTRMDTKQCITKERQTKNSHKNGKYVK